MKCMPPKSAVKDWPETLSGCNSGKSDEALVQVVYDNRSSGYVGDF